MGGAPILLSQVPDSMTLYCYPAIPRGYAIAHPFAGAQDYRATAFNALVHESGHVCWGPAGDGRRKRESGNSIRARLDTWLRRGVFDWEGDSDWESDSDRES
jgi:hypothetical protein